MPSSNNDCSSTDLAYLRRALELAAQGRYHAWPNPQVGAVVVKDGRIIGEGWHRKDGGPHAEVEAFRDAGEETEGATLYVSLEPCDFDGRTPACSKATLEAGIRRVVACTRDPHPRVDGGGFARLARAGVEVAHGFLVPEAVRLNWRPFVNAVRQRPAVTLKWAMSLDGRIATATGDSQWISGQEGRQWGLDQREVHDAILVGIGTALADDPRLNRRLQRADGAISRVILDRRLRLPPTSSMFEVPGPVLIYARHPAPRDQVHRLEDRGAIVIELAEVTPQAVLEDLYRSRQVRSLLVEGGGEIHAAFTDSGAWDRVAVDCAPMLIGGSQAPGPLAGIGASSLSSAPRLLDMKFESKGEDVILTAFRKECLQALYESVAD